MSKIALTPNASGSGTFTIASPNSDTDRSLTLPDGAGTLDRLERTGNVIQVVHGSTSTERSSTANSYIDSYLEATITPTSSTSKILVLVDQKINVYMQSALIYNYAGCRLLRDATTLLDDFYAVSIEAGGSSNGNISTTSRIPINYLDSPATTSSVTYKTQFKTLRTGNGGSSTVQLGGNPSTITLMEIAG